MSIYVNSYKTTKNEIPNNKYKLKNIKTFTKEKSNGTARWVPKCIVKKMVNL